MFITTCMRRCLLTALLVCAAPSFAADESMGRPQVRAGDLWVYRQTSLINRKMDEFSYRVTAAADGRITTDASGQRDIYSTDWNLIESSSGVKISPHEGYFRFPLAPGMVYPFKAQRTVARVRAAWEGMVTVGAWETIDVAAGRWRVAGACNKVIGGRARCGAGCAMICGSASPVGPPPIFKRAAS
jgi:hypothetical protein